MDHTLSAARTPPERVWTRLSHRVTASAAQARAVITRRAADQPADRTPHGAVVRTLHVATAALRAGEPARVRIVELAAGTRTTLLLDGGARSEWLVLDGLLTIDCEPLARLDFHVRPGGASAAIASAAGARVLVREAGADRPWPAAPTTVHAASAVWAGQPGMLSQCLLWSDGDEATSLVRMPAGCRVPAHRHGHDEECLMLDGEIYLDDVLLFGGDWQLAPAGGLHTAVSSDTGALLYVRGDRDVQFVAAAEGA